MMVHKVCCNSASVMVCPLCAVAEPFRKMVQCKTQGLTLREVLEFRNGFQIGFSIMKTTA